MSDILFVGDYAYSSWSMRAGLLFDRFDLPVKITSVPFHSRDVAEQLLDLGLGSARTVPTLKTADGAVIPDSLAIAEELASRHPAAGLWPADPALRAAARVLTAEMHSSFAALRNACPMNLRNAYRDVPVDADVTQDLARLDDIWGAALAQSGGPWLCGDYSIADAFYAPVAARIAGYGLAVGPTAQAYVAQHLADPAFRRWRAIGLVKGETLPWYARDYGQVQWPGPEPLHARAVKTGPSENDACPYSGKPVQHFLETGGRVFGFCNSTCRDKTVADPEVWPRFVQLLQTT